MDHLLRPHHAAKGGCRAFQGDAPAMLEEFGRRVVGRRDPINLPSRRYMFPNVASQRRTAFSSIVLNAGSSSPRELLMTWSTSDVAACCSNASARCCRASARSRLYFSSCCSRSRRGWRFRRTRVPGLVPVERRPRARVRLFSPFRDKVTSSARSFDACWSPQAEDPADHKRLARRADCCVRSFTHLCRLLRPTDGTRHQISVRDGT
jgi:hypothetical protein